MRLRTIFGVATALLFITACGKSGGTLNITLDAPESAASNGNINTSSNSKPLFSIWTASDNTYTMDLRSVKFGVSSNGVATVFGQTCSCKVLAQGSETSGTMAISSCSSTTIDCSSFNISGTYTKSSANILQVCDSTNTCLSLK